MCLYLHTYRSHVISDTASKNVDLKAVLHQFWVKKIFP